jgi:hypothetical protein
VKGRTYLSLPLLAIAVQNLRTGKVARGGVEFQMKSFRLPPKTPSLHLCQKDFDGIPFSEGKENCISYSAVRS